MFLNSLDSLQKATPGIEVRDVVKYAILATMAAIIKIVASKRRTWRATLAEFVTGILSGSLVTFILRNKESFQGWLEAIAILLGAFATEIIRSFPKWWPKIQDRVLDYLIKAKSGREKTEEDGGDA